MEKLTIESAKQFLKDNGYFVDNLWQIEDVQHRYECTDEKAQEILNDALSNSATVEQIQFAKSMSAECENIPKKVNEEDLFEEFEEGEQNRFRNNDHRSFEEWKEDKLND